MRSKRQSGIIDLSAINCGLRLGGGRLGCRCVTTINFEGENLVVGVGNFLFLVVLGGDIHITKLNSVALFQASSLLGCRSADCINKAGKILLILTGLLVLAANRNPQLYAGV